MKSKDNNADILTINVKDVLYSKYINDGNVKHKNYSACD